MTEELLRRLRLKPVSHNGDEGSDESTGGMPPESESNASSRKGVSSGTECL